MNHTNLEALSFFIVLAFPKASSKVFACTKRSFISFISNVSPDTRTKNCNTILAASVFPEPLSPESEIKLQILVYIVNLDMI